MTEDLERKLRRELEMLAYRYGKAAVRRIAAEVTKRGRGRPSEPDYQRLRPWFIELAVAYARDEIGKTNYRIGEEFARQHPGHSSRATAERIEKKLKDWRKEASADYLVDTATKSELTYNEYIQGLEQARVEAITAPFPFDNWQELIKDAQEAKDSIAWDYTERMTMAEIEQLAAKYSNPKI